MTEFYIPNREFIKNLAFNTGTSSNPTFTPICTTSEITIATDLTTQDFAVFCDAIQRKIVTGASVTLSGSIKLDLNNAAEKVLLDAVHTLIADGEIAQFNNQLVQFDLVTDVNNGVLEYTTYQVPVTYTLSDLGGAAEDVSEFSFEMSVVGKGSVVASA